MPYRKPHSFFLGGEDRLLQLLGLAAGGFLLLIIVQILLPWLVLAALVGTGYWIWRRRKKQERDLYQLFYDLIQANGGRISVLDFAIAACLTGPQARAFLDARAREFYANFEPTDHGDVLYTFSSPQLQKLVGEGEGRGQGEG